MMFLPRWFILTVGIVAILLWVASFVAGIMLPSYHPDPVIGWAIMVVVSASFTTEAVKSLANRLIKKRKELQKQLVEHDESAKEVTKYESDWADDDR